MKSWLHTVDRGLERLTDHVTSLLLLTIAVVVIYSVVMRYVFLEPPFWTDVVSMFANMGMILLGLSITVRHRELIAMQALYEGISPRFACALDALWNVVILLFSIIYTWFGLEAALNIPGFYWELGGLEQKYPALIMPLSGVLLIIAGVGVVARDIKRFRNFEPGGSVGTQPRAAGGALQAPPKSSGRTET